MNKKKGILFWITGLSGSGKTTIAKKILPFIESTCGVTVHLDGDNLRNILELYGYSFEDRLSNSRKFTKIAKLLTDQGVNVVFSLVGLMNKPRNCNRKNIKNYIEIFVKSDVKKIIASNKKKIYKTNKNLVGINIKPEFPKKPHITINNSFKQNFNVIEKNLKLKLLKVLSKKKYVKF
jgi:adenylylsulfate kinase-like enzyme